MTILQVLEAGDRAYTPLGPGIVVYKRYGTHDNVIAYSIALDDRVAESERPPFRSYSGTIFDAKDVSP